MKHAWIAEQGNVFALVEMCDVLDVSISGYRAWKRGGQPHRQRLSECAVQRRCFPAGANPARPLSHRPEATGAVMEETKWLKPLV